MAQYKNSQNAYRNGRQTSSRAYRGNSAPSRRRKEPDLASMTKKERKIYNKSSKFDESDLRNYPMTVGSWIGTFILLAIPVLNVLCAICWFFGAGNRSRAAWIRSYVVIALIIALLVGILLGVGYVILSKNAKAEGYEGMNGTLYYSACKVIDMLEPTLGGPEKTQPIKDMLAEKLGLSNNGEENNGEDSQDQQQEQQEQQEQAQA